MWNGWLLLVILLPLVSSFFCPGLYDGISEPNQRQGRNSFALLVAGLVFLLLILLSWQVYQGQKLHYVLNGICGWGLGFVMDGFRAIFSVITAFVWFLTTLVVPEQLGGKPRNWYSFFSLLTLGATLGVFLSADFFTTYVFFEVMTFASYGMILQSTQANARQSGAIYLTFGIVGGLAMLLGMAGLYTITGTLEFSELLLLDSLALDQSTLWVSGLLIFFGFAVKSGVFPVHITLAPAYEAAPAPASAILSSILSKTGVYGLVLVSMYVFRNQPAWSLLMLAFGLLTMYAGAILALFNTQIKRILAYSSMSQIGFILLGIGMTGLLGAHNAFGARGSLLHMVNHSLVKLVFFLAVGVLAAALPNLDLNDLRGYGKGKPILHMAFLCGALGIMGVPLFNGYISKTLLHESIVIYLHDLEALGAPILNFKIIEILFIVAGGLTAAYISKIYVALFWEKGNAQAREQDLGKRSAIALLTAAILLPLLGLLPWLMEGIADFGEGFLLGWPLDHPVEYLAWINLKGAVYSLGIGLLVYLGLIRGFLLRKEKGGVAVYLNRWPQALDLTERFYRPLIIKVLPDAGTATAMVFFQAGNLGFDAMLQLIPLGYRLAKGMFNFVEKAMSMFQVVNLGHRLANGIFNIAEEIQHGLMILLQVMIYLAGRLFDIVETVLVGLVQRLYYFFKRLSGQKVALERNVEKREDWPHFIERVKNKYYKKSEASALPMDRSEHQKIMNTIQGGISYSLLMFGIGLIITMVYLLNIR
jgi:formate hydrogenlyase subunit 3/multisubunit Na+/H+ antiporter MnhD subunit